MITTEATVVEEDKPDKADKPKTGAPMDSMY
jgi:hypothetical protein